MIYQTPEEKARWRAVRNVYFLAAVFALSTTAVYEKMQARQLATATPSAEVVSKITRRLCVEIDGEDYLVVCPD